MKKLQVSIEPVQLSHLIHVAENMREADRAEVWSSSALNPYKSLEYSLKCSTKSWAGTVDGEAICIFGVAPLSFVSKIGSPWLLGTDKIIEHAIPFLRRNKKIISEMHQIYDRLENMVHADNTASKQWLKWMGFTIEEEVRFGPFNRQFNPFWKEKAHV